MPLVRNKSHHNTQFYKKNPPIWISTIFYLSILHFYHLPCPCPKSRTCLTITKCLKFINTLDKKKQPFCWFQIFATCATFYVPLLVILFLYWRIFQAARRRIRKRPGTTIQPPRERRGILRLVRRRSLLLYTRSIYICILRATVTTATLLFLPNFTRGRHAGHRSEITEQRSRSRLRNSGALLRQVVKSAYGRPSSEEDSPRARSLIRLGLVFGRAQFVQLVICVTLFCAQCLWINVVLTLAYLYFNELVKKKSYLYFKLLVIHF